MYKGTVHGIHGTCMPPTHNLCKRVMASQGPVCLQSVHRPCDDDLPLMPDAWLKGDSSLIEPALNTRDVLAQATDRGRYGMSWLRPQMRVDMGCPGSGLYTLYPGV